MKLSALQLKHYYYNHLQLETLQSEEPFDNEQASPYWVPVANNIEISIAVGEPHESDVESDYVFIISLKLSHHEKDFPYKFIVAMDGVFSCDDMEETLQDFQRQLVVNATSVLYSSVREQLLTLSSRQKYGPLMLPTLDFRTLKKADADNLDGTAGH